MDFHQIFIHRKIMRNWIRKNSLVACLFILPFVGVAQVDTLTIEEFLQVVDEHHPVSYQINNNLKQGALELKAAQGGFEPVIEANYNRKSFEGKDYYNKFGSSLVVPIWFGLSAETGYEINSGDFINPEIRTSATGMWYSGININLVQSLTYNGRMANLDRGKIINELTIEEQKIAKNELLRDAAVQYWEWYAEYEKLLMYKKIFNLAKERFELTKQLFSVGESAQMDTIESQGQYLNRKISYEKQEATFRMAQNKLNLYLWKEGIVPLEIKNLIPANKTLEFNISVNDIDSVVQNHALMKIANFELNLKTIDLRLSRQKVLPKLDVNLYYLDNPGASQKGEWYNNSYVGMKFNYPILSIQARNKMKIKELEVANKKLDIQMKQQSLAVKMQNVYLNDEVLAQNLADIELVVQSTQTLLNNEQEKFRAGETTLLKVNLRENYLLNSKLKRIELFQKYQKNKHYMAWYALYF